MGPGLVDGEGAAVLRKPQPAFGEAWIFALDLFFCGIARIDDDRKSKRLFDDVAKSAGLVGRRHAIP
jgi:hypothetical protein